jgi:hypothetical protein
MLAKPTQGLFRHALKIGDAAQDMANILGDLDMGSHGRNYASLGLVFIYCFVRF